MSAQTDNCLVHGKALNKNDPPKTHINSLNNPNFQYELNIHEAGKKLLGQPIQQKARAGPRKRRFRKLRQMAAGLAILLCHISVDIRMYRCRHRLPSI